MVMPPLPTAQNQQKAGSIKAVLSAWWSFYLIQLACSIAVGMTLGFVFGLAAYSVGSMAGISMDAQMSASLLSSSIGTLLGAVAAWTMIKNKGLVRKICWSFKDLSWKTVLIGLCLSYAGGLVLNQFTLLIEALCEVFGYMLPLSGFIETGGVYSTVIYVIMVLFIGPIIEELIFRGVFFNALRSFNWIFAAIFTSLLFGMLHMNFFQGLNVLALSLVCCWAYEKTDNLLVCIALHFFNNLIALLTMVDSVYLAAFLNGATLIMALAGFVLLVVKARDSGHVVSVKMAASRPLWSMVFPDWRFWLIVAFFVISSVITIIAGI